MAFLFNAQDTSKKPDIAGVQVQSSIYGVAIPIVYGTNRISGNIFWLDDKTSTATFDTSSTGGGVSGSGSSQTQTGWDYKVSLMMGIGEGPIQSINAVWLNNSLASGYTTTATDYGVFLSVTNGTIMTVPKASQYANIVSMTYNGLFGELTVDSNAYINYGNGSFKYTGGGTINITIKYNYYVSTSDILSSLNMTLFKGNMPQSTWGFLTSNHPTKALAYNGLSYIASPSYDLGSNTSLPNMNFAVTGLYSLANGLVNPATAIFDFLTNVRYGVGFPSAQIDTMDLFSNYCLANGLTMGWAIDRQDTASNIITSFLGSLNTAVFWSEGLIKFRPYGDVSITANGVIYTPNTTPVYDLTDDDFIGDDEPIKVTRLTNADAFNFVQVEYLDSSKEYNPSTAEVKDMGNIQQFGVRQSGLLQMHWITNATTAKQVAQLIMQRMVYIRNTYEFRISWKYCLLEPMDIVTLTDSYLGFDKLPVRIKSIEEDSEYTLTITAEEYPFAIASATTYPSNPREGTSKNYYISAGSVNAPVIFKAPLKLSLNNQVWFGVNGGQYFGGCDIWMSYDNTTFSYVGNLPYPSITGQLSVDWNTGNIVTVDLTECRGVLSTSTYQLALIGDEVVAYSSVSLISAYVYQITVTNRALYDTTQVAHLHGSQFAKLDNNIFKQDFNDKMLDIPLYYKFLSYNIYGSAKQSLSDVASVQFTISSDIYPPTEVANIYSNIVGNNVYLWWDKSLDYDVINGGQYEIRFNKDMTKSWDACAKIGTVQGNVNNFMTPYAYGAYQIKSINANGIYSILANKTTVQDLQLINTNVLVTKQYNFFTDTPSASSNISFDTTAGDCTLLVPTANIDSWVSNIDDIADFDFGDPYGIDLTQPNTGYFVTQSFDLGKNLKSRFTLDYNFSSYLANDTIDGRADNIDSWGDFDAYSPNNNIQVTFFIATSLDNVNWTSWQQFQIADYQARYFKIKVVAYAASISINFIMDKLEVIVDVPDIIETETFTSNASGITKTVNLVNTFAILPKITASVNDMDASNGYFTISNITTTSFDFIVYNTNNRTVTYTAKGY